jgi:hypothetical protein
MSPWKKPLLCLVAESAELDATGEVSSPPPHPTTINMVKLQSPKTSVNLTEVIVSPSFESPAGSVNLCRSPRNESAIHKCSSCRKFCPIAEGELGRNLITCKKTGPQTIKRPTVGQYISQSLPKRNTREVPENCIVVRSVSSVLPLGARTHVRHFQETTRGPFVTHA